MLSVVDSVLVLARINRDHNFTLKRSHETTLTRETGKSIRKVFSLLATTRKPINLTIKDKR